MKLFGKIEVDVAKEMSVRILEATRDNRQISNLLCPSCTEQKMRAVTVERGKTGWEARFFCEVCKTAGVLNHTGFHVELAYREAKK